MLLFMILAHHSLMRTVRVNLQLAMRRCAENAVQVAIVVVEKENRQPARNLR